LTEEHLVGLDPALAALDPVLEDGIDAMSLTLAPSQRRRLFDYLALLIRWNRAFNLTAVDQPRAMVARHLLDSLSVLPWLVGSTVVDSGTGAGLPGVVLAIASPQRRFTLIDSNGKKVRFLRQVRRSLNLNNVEPVQARLEALAERAAPDTVTARALAPLERLVAWHRPWLETGSRLVAMKARLDDDERSAVPDAYNVERVDLRVPGLDASRCLAIVTMRQS
jgi:16S rRNA (guanine527-N7)-methyltransferase